MLTLRPDQERFVADLRAAYAGGARSVLGVAPTGAGKTVMFSHMTRSAVSRGRRVGIMAHRVELIDQVSRALFDMNVPHGIVAPGRDVNPFEPVQVCSVFSVARRIERYSKRPFDFLVIDEAHHCAAGTTWHAVAKAHASARILGVTATPERLSGEPLADVFSQMVVGPSVRELIDLGALSDYRAFAPRTVDLSDVKRRAGDFAKDQLADRVDKPSITGDAVAEYTRRARGKRAICFCVSVAHAEHVAATFRAAGISAASIDGKMDRGVRARIIAGYRRGDPLVLTAADLVSEGFDLPAIECAILLRPTASLGLYLQQVGRSLRPYPGKPYALIMDHAGNIARHGLPDEPRAWSLAGHAGKPSSAISGPQVRLCDGCYGAFRPAPVCPYCGKAQAITPRVVQEVAGELEEVDRDLQRAARQREEQRARTIGDLARIAHERGYRSGWIVAKCKARGMPVSWPLVQAAISAARSHAAA